MAVVSNYLVDKLLYLEYLKGNASVLSIFYLSSIYKGKCLSRMQFVRN